MGRTRSLERVLGAATKALVLGIGGGGDVVGALATARLCQAFGAEFVLGGVSWERWPIDPYPGPRPMAEILGRRPLSPTSTLADIRTTTPDGTPFAESRMAGFLRSDTILIDVTKGTAGVVDGVRETARQLGCDLVAFIDVGGDVLAHGHEEGLASPLCDAVMLAAAIELSSEINVIAGVYEPGCDGELETDEVMDRICELARAGAILGSWGLTPNVIEEIEAAAEVVHTEASLMAAKCARGETGDAEMRGGRRSASLGPIGAITYFFDPSTATSEAIPLARAVGGTRSLDEAQDNLSALGIRTELDFEREKAESLAG